MLFRRLRTTIAERSLRKRAIRLYAELDEVGARPLTEGSARATLAELTAIRARIDQAEEALAAMELGPAEPNSALHLLRLEHEVAQKQLEAACLAEQVRILDGALERAEASAVNRRRARNKRKRVRKRKGR